jgi:hypothetical protein
MRVRARENPMFSTALSRASHLKVVCLGDSYAPQLSLSSSVPLSDLKLHALGDSCDQDILTMVALTVACAVVSLDAP